MTMSLMQFWSDLSPLAWFGLKLAQVGAFVLILSVLLAFLILMDRKVWAAVQMRRGPNVVGPWGLLQSCLLYTSPSPRDKRQSRMPSSA